MRAGQKGIMMPPESELRCKICAGTNIVKHMPKEIGRKLDHEEISVPDESGQKKLTVAMLRITYQREYFCAGCGHQWTETYIIDKQHHV